MNHFIFNFIIFPFILISFLSCEEKDNTISIKNLELKREIAIAVLEPSGLTYSANKSSFYTVSDHTAQIYKLSLTGALIGVFDFKGSDLEGITVDSNTGDIYVVEERKREVVKLDKSGNLMSRFRLDISQNDNNSGLEGITFNTNNNHIYVLNEKDPGLLIEIDRTGKIIKQAELDFASDYSGIFYEENENVLWIISDQSKTINKCDLFGKRIISYKINDKKAEGIVVNPNAKEIYIVLDGEDKLQVYEYE